MLRSILTAAALAGSAALPLSAMAQQSPPVVVSPGNTLLTVSAEGEVMREPDIAVFSAGVVTTGKTAREALSANSTAMTRVIAALKRSGIADRDIQTSNLSVTPVYANRPRQPGDSLEQQVPPIIGYRANNSVSVRHRNLDEYGRVIDTLIEAGANNVNGPDFQLDDPDTALDEARVRAVRKARERAELYARAAGLRVSRILSISESGFNYGPPPVMYARMASDEAMPAPPPAPMQPGEMRMTTNVTIQYELAP
ncbi:hypothetical protein GCM10011371_01320 [Novosphingobium marinum]|uniref:SIMPL domain-containing protein n=1 Tax=Novosphingobium marinum TaxID=1514948 RepID=A0A7Y9XSM8_9SPHN|nr:SIMPL domain-containing protein [Novosphingobium marinum]NYH93824.1 hypothetical protein [Novosphingobium marinum]GGC17566.1 hypothetical protein GCM10011371_01320 [Novosphingobium marinum]